MIDFKNKLKKVLFIQISFVNLANKRQVKGLARQVHITLQLY